MIWVLDHTFCTHLKQGVFTKPPNNYIKLSLSTFSCLESKQFEVFTIYFTMLIDWSSFFTMSLLEPEAASPNWQVTMPAFFCPCCSTGTISMTAQGLVFFFFLCLVTDLTSTCYYCLASRVPPLPPTETHLFPLRAVTRLFDKEGDWECHSKCIGQNYFIYSLSMQQTNKG